MAVDQHFRIGADIGGTFTDIVVLGDDGACLTRKVLSTPDDYARGIVGTVSDLLNEQQYSAQHCDEIIHGTTIATNTILESKGAKTGLITTQGFRDVLEFRRLRVPMLYNLRFQPPTPIVERRLRVEVVERIDATGTVITPLDETSVIRVIDFLRDEGVEAIAVSLIHSYRSSEHEKRIQQLVEERLPGVFLTLSSEVLPEIREYERTSTTVINAYVGPMVRQYLNSLRRKLAAENLTCPLAVMQSSGGIMSAESAASKPASIVESGPAAGVIASQRAGARAGISDLITFDMGGTTAKAALIEDGHVNLTTEYEVGAAVSVSNRLLKGGGHALKLPVLDIAEVGAGGGSIVWIDRGGALKVGPRSAGATPGPACYNLGGTEPTVTDANVVLGYVNPDSLAGGTLTLDAERAYRAMAEVASRLEMGVEQAAHGVRAVANASMIRAIKAVSTYRGRDPRDFALLAFGGSGPLHAADIAQSLGIDTVIIPSLSGVFSALGLLEAVPEHHYVQTVMQNAGIVVGGHLEGIYRRMEVRARRMLTVDGYDGDQVSFHRQADLRYVGQAYELTVNIDHDLSEQAQVLAVVERFGEEHERTYGHRAEGEPVEFVNVRTVARVETTRRDIFPNFPGSSEQRTRRAYFGDTFLATPVLARGDLQAQLLPGPFIVEDYDATTVVPPNCAARLDEWGSIVMDIRDA